MSLFVRDKEELYALAIRTARAFERFRHIHRAYLDQVTRDRARAAPCQARRAGRVPARAFVPSLRRSSGKYQIIEQKRAWERLVQVSVEAAILHHRFP